MLPKTARSAQTHKSISFIWIVLSTLWDMVEPLDSNTNFYVNLQRTVLDSVIWQFSLSGHTTVKIKGKSHRLRTPTCAALRRLSETLKLEESSSSNVPSKISLILTPLTTDDFDKGCSSIYLWRHQNSFMRLTDL